MNGQLGTAYGDQRQHAADRQIDPARDDNQGHAAGEDSVHGRLPQRVEEAAASLKEGLTGVEEEIQQTQSTSFYDPLGYPGQIAAQLAYVHSAAAGGFGGVIDAAPTDGAIERFQDLQVQVNEILGRLQQIMDVDLTAFNELLRSLELDPIVVEADDEPAVISDDGA